jgi:hypothetical protein
MDVIGMFPRETLGHSILAFRFLRMIKKLLGCDTSLVLNLIIPCSLLQGLRIFPLPEGEG